MCLSACFFSSILPVPILHGSMSFLMSHTTLKSFEWIQIIDSRHYYAVLWRKAADGNESWPVMFWKFSICLCIRPVYFPTSIINGADTRDLLSVPCSNGGDFCVCMLCIYCDVMCLEIFYSNGSQITWEVCVLSQSPFELCACVRDWRSRMAKGSWLLENYSIVTFLPLKNLIQTTINMNLLV